MLHLSAKILGQKAWETERLQECGKKWDYHKNAVYFSPSEIK
jgi:hypothetical protein